MALRKRLSGDDRQLRHQITELEEELQSYTAEYGGPFGEDAHAQLDAALDSALDRVKQVGAELATMHALDWTAYSKFGGLLAATQPQFRQLWHDAIDEPEGRPGWPAFSRISKGEFESKVEKLRQGIADREAELARRDVVRRREELEAELQALEGDETEEEKVVA